MGILSPSGVEALLLKKVLKLLNTALSQPNRRGGSITLEDFVTFLDEDDKTSKKVFEVLLLETCLRKRRDDPQSTSQASSSTISTVRPSASSRSRAERWPNLPDHDPAAAVPVSSLLQFVDDSDDSDEADHLIDWRVENGMGLDPSAEDFDEMLFQRIRDAEAAEGGGNAATSRAARVRRRQDRETAPRSTLAELLSAGPVPTVVLPAPAAPTYFPAYSRPSLPFPNPTFEQLWRAAFQDELSPACDSMEEYIRRLNARLSERAGPSFRPLVAAAFTNVQEIVDPLEVRIPGTINRLRGASANSADRADRRAEGQADEPRRRRLLNSTRHTHPNLDDMLIETPFAFREDIDNGADSDSGFSFDWATLAPELNGPAGAEDSVTPHEDDLFEQFSRRRRSLANFRERNESSDGIVREGMEMLEMRRATRELDQIRDRLVREDNYDSRRRESRRGITTSASSVASTSSAWGSGSGSGSRRDTTSGASTPATIASSATTPASSSSSTNCPTPAPIASVTVPRTSAWIAEEAARQRRAIRPLPARAVAGS